MKTKSSAKKTETTHHVYVVRCSDNSLYTGYAVDPERRLEEHNGNTKVQGARYTRGRRPVQLVYVEKCASRSEAMRREAAIKQLSRIAKENLIKKI